MLSNRKVIPFYDDTLILLGNADDPMVAMRPIVENMGLAWTSQRVKLSEKFKSVVTIIVTTGNDGKNYEMVCLPLRKLAAWLYTINPNKVNPELRDKVIRYQNECDDVLWKYWQQNEASFRRIQLVAPKEPGWIEGGDVLPFRLKMRDVFTLQDQKRAILRQIDQSRDPAVRAALYIDLCRICDVLGREVPELAEFSLPDASD